LDLTDPTRVERKKMGKYERDVIISYSHLLSRLFKSLLYSRENMSSVSNLNQSLVGINIYTHIVRIV
jgi:hypothetical protein